MTVHLLDASVLVALVDGNHEFNTAAEHWLAANHEHGWATCPLTENAVLRIVGRRGYPRSPGPPAAVVPLLADLLMTSGHVYGPDDISLLDGARVVRDRLTSHASLTDTYLLALAVAHGGALATFDRRLDAAAVPGGASALQVIATA